MQCLAKGRIKKKKNAHCHDGPNKLKRDEHKDCNFSKEELSKR